LNVVFKGLLCLAMLVLVGCAAPTSPQSTRSDFFTRQGRFAIQSQQVNGTTDAVQGGFNWVDQGSKLTLDLTSPMGSTLARVQVSANESVLTQSNGQQVHAKTPDELMLIAIGQPVPVLGLREWMAGRLAPQGNRAIPASDVVNNEQGRLSAFTQDGWRVELSRYDGQGPRLLSLRRDQDGQQISVRLVID